MCIYLYIYIYVLYVYIHVYIYIYIHMSVLRAGPGRDPVGLLCKARAPRYCYIFVLLLLLLLVVVVVVCLLSLNTINVTLLLLLLVLLLLLLFTLRGETSRPLWSQPQPAGKSGIAPDCSLRLTSATSNYVHALVNLASLRFREPLPSSKAK